MAYLALTMGMPALKWAGGQLWEVVRGEAKERAQKERERDEKEKALEAKLEKLVGKLETHVTQGFDRVLAQLASQDGSIRVLNTKVEALDERQRALHEKNNEAQREIFALRAELATLRRRDE